MSKKWIYGSKTGVIQYGQKKSYIRTICDDKQGDIITTTITEIPTPQGLPYLAFLSVSKPQALIKIWPYNKGVPFNWLVIWLHNGEIVSHAHIAKDFLTTFGKQTYDQIINQ